MPLFPIKTIAADVGCPCEFAMRAELRDRGLSAYQFSAHVAEAIGIKRGPAYAMLLMLTNSPRTPVSEKLHRPRLAALKRFLDSQNIKRHDDQN